jgi:hypothetical protein
MDRCIANAAALASNVAGACDAACERNSHQHAGFGRIVWLRISTSLVS